jgi:maleylacetoacetate isomerase/maleylpyruvate isomerase
VDMSQFPVLLEIEDHCSQLRAFQKAHPSKQPDAQT